MSYKVVAKWEYDEKKAKRAVAEAVAEVPGGVAAATRVAKAVQRNARAALLGYHVAGSKIKTQKIHTSDNPDAGQNISPDATLEPYRNLVAKEIIIKPVQVFPRRKVVPGSPIPVALVGADHWASQPFEFGRGMATPAAHFMGTGARAAAGKNVEFMGPGRSR